VVTLIYVVGKYLHEKQLHQRQLELAHASAHTSTRTIERQVLVTRCRWCQHLTAVDIENCGNCGGHV